jgi:hypothetical protein
MRTMFPTRNQGASDTQITVVVFGACVVAREHSTDQVAGWIDSAFAGRTAADLEEIAAAIRRIGDDYAARTPAALAA